MNQKTAHQYTDFSCRIEKRYKHLSKWAKRTDVHCFRLYDADIPEVPIVVDLYKSDDAQDALYAHIALYERPYEKDMQEELEWLSVMQGAVCTVLDIPAERIFTKIRKKQRGESQYEKIAANSVSFPVRECGARFLVNLSDYIDTGLFFDHRPLRSIVRQKCAKKDVLNLFCYTGSFSVYAALGGAASIDSVDLSANYLDWARQNIELNIPGATLNQQKYRFIREDVTAFLSAAKSAHSAFRNRWDIIILDPPTFSNSKRAKNMLDINADWPSLVNNCLDLLEPDGTVYFSTNSQKLRFNVDAITHPAVCIRDITFQTIPEDFKNKKPHKCWEIHKN